MTDSRIWSDLQLKLKLSVRAECGNNNSNKNTNNNINIKSDNNINKNNNNNKNNLSMFEGDMKSIRNSSLKNYLSFFYYIISYNKSNKNNNITDGL